MSTPRELPARAAPAIEDEFFELVCADEQLLTAEFDAIIAEAWGDSQPPTEASHASAPSSREGHRRVTGSAMAESRPPRTLSAVQWSRQRSPPTGPNRHLRSQTSRVHADRK